MISVVRFQTSDNNLFLATTSFGNHALHHLFPTVDHSKLPLLLPTYIETCKEFGIVFNDDFFQKRDASLLSGWIACLRQVCMFVCVCGVVPFYVMIFACDILLEYVIFILCSKYEQVKTVF